MPNYRRLRITGHPVFVTVVTHRREAWLHDADRVETLLGAMRWARTRYPFRHLAHVVLPDHFHWLLAPAAGTSLSALVGAVKRDTTWRLREEGHEGPLWQNRFYDHVIRDEEDLGRHLDYIHFNPVKHGYVARATDYPWSTFQEWVKRGVYEADWGSMAPEWMDGMELE